MPEQISFSLEEGERLKTTGMERAVEWTPKEIFEFAQWLANGHAHMHGHVTIDDVYRLLEQSDKDISLLGPSAGSIFKGKQWECIGWRKSSRASNHARAIRIWRLKT